MSKTRRPLILTRPEAASCQFAERIGAWLPDHVEVIISPLLDLVATGNPVDLEGISGAIFSSPNGVAFSPAANLPAFCVGEETTRAALAKGWDARKSGNTSNELVAELTKNPKLEPLLHLSGVHTRGEIADRLAQAGIKTRNIASYDQRLKDLSASARAALEGGIEPIIPLFSPRTARHLVDQGGIAVPLHIVAISDAVMKPTEALEAASRTVAKQPNAAGMEETLHALIDRLEA